MVGSIKNSISDQKVEGPNRLQSRASLSLKVISQLNHDDPPEDPFTDNSPPVEPSLHSWNDFESQYLSASEQSAIVEREHWGGQLEFLMSCIASAVGLGNIWRFPFICGQNGGGAFLIPYFIVVTVIGRPMYMLECALGQFSSGGPVRIWEMLPAFKGVGFGSAIASFCMSTFYCVIMGWALLYFYYSFYDPLPWNKDVWSPPLQEPVKLKGLAEHERIHKFFENGHLGLSMDKKESERDFYLGKGLDGAPVFNVAIALLSAWILIWLTVVGVSASGKIAYFTALFPYVVLIILLITGCTLEGAGKGVMFFLKPTWERILHPQTWFAAIGQCFFSLGVTYGECMAFSSFNSFHHKLERDVWIISVMDTLASVLAGTFVFSLIGNLSHRTNVSIETIAENGGTGMAFETFPAVLLVFKDNPGGPQVFSLVFFFMLIILAVGSANGLVSSVTTSICDAFPKLHRYFVVTGICIFYFLTGLIYVCPSGTRVMDIVDRHGSEMVVYVVAIFEVVGILWIYGVKNISNDFEFMFGYPVNWYWIICWCSIPWVLFTIFIGFLITYRMQPEWPTSAHFCGWTLTIIAWSVIPLVWIRVVQTRKSRFLIKRIKATFYPTRRWGPKNPETRKAWRQFKKTKPTEFLWTTKVLKALRLRNHVKENNLHNLTNWSRNNNLPNSPEYQAKVDLSAHENINLQTKAPIEEIEPQNI